MNGVCASNLGLQVDIDMMYLYTTNIAGSLVITPRPTLVLLGNH